MIRFWLLLWKPFLARVLKSVCIRLIGDFNATFVFCFRWSFGILLWEIFTVGKLFYTYICRNETFNFHPSRFLRPQTIFWGLVYIDPKAKRHRLQTGSLRIQFNVHIEPNEAKRSIRNDCEQSFWRQFYVLQEVTRTLESRLTTRLWINWRKDTGWINRRTPLTKCKLYLPIWVFYTLGKSTHYFVFNANSSIPAEKSSQLPGYELGTQWPPL